MSDSSLDVCVLKITRDCKDCKTTFSVSQSEVKWLLSKGLEIYTRCPDCRKKRRENNG